MNTASWTLELPLLETSRLRLRKLAIEDAADIFAYASDPEVTRYLRFSEHKSMADSRAFLLRTLQSYRSGADLLWGIELKSAGRIIGGCRLNCNFQHRAAEVGYVLARGHWGQGFAPEAVLAVAGFAFTRTEINRIEARCMTDHAASSRVLEKCGFHFEGIARESEWIKGKFTDLKIFSLLRAEWLSRG